MGVRERIKALEEALEKALTDTESNFNIEIRITPDEDDTRYYVVDPETGKKSEISEAEAVKLQKRILKAYKSSRGKKDKFIKITVEGD